MVSLPPDASERLGDRLAAALEEADVPLASWKVVRPQFIEEWEQGQHLITLGKTGQGKTTFAIDAIEGRLDQRHDPGEPFSASVCSFVTKKRDDTSAELLDRLRGWSKIGAWPPSYAQRKKRRLILWPPYTKPSTYANDVRAIFKDALDEIMEEGAWTLFLDEASYMVESLKLRTSMDEFFTQARSNGITLVAGSQRPVWVSRAMVSQHSWVCAFRIGDLDDARRGGEVMGDRVRYTPILQNLSDHQFLLVNTNTDQAVVSKVGT